MQSQGLIAEGYQVHGEAQACPIQGQAHHTAVIEEFVEEPGVAEWMHELADLIKQAVETDILDDPGVLMVDLRKLLRRPTGLIPKESRLAGARLSVCLKNHVNP